MASSTIVIGIVVVVLVAVGAVYVLSSGKPSAGYSTTPTTVASTQGYVSTVASTTAATSASTTAASSTIPAKTDTFSISESEYSFNQSVLNVKSGDTVMIKVTNKGTTTHNLVVLGVNAATPNLSPGQNATLTFTAPASGNYTFYCGVDGHRGLGMQGTLVVR